MDLDTKNQDAMNIYSKNQEHHEKRHDMSVRMKKYDKWPYKTPQTIE